MKLSELTNFERRAIEFEDDELVCPNWFEPNSRYDLDVNTIACPYCEHGDSCKTKINGTALPIRCVLKSK